jgi:hypothetical protein
MTIEQMYARCRNYPEPGLCWEWPGAHRGESIQYGVAWDSVRRRHVGTHRWSHDHAKGPIPAGMWVLHHCDNGLCANPAHLYVGREMENARDRVVRDRGRYGSRHGRHKLTESQVVAIREPIYRRGLHRALAREYGVSEAAISLIRHGHKWIRVGRRMSGALLPILAVGESR